MVIRLELDKEIYMEKRTFRVTIDNVDKIVNIHNKNEKFVLSFRDEDEWNSFTMADGQMYDIHLLWEDGWEVSIYRVIHVMCSDGGDLEMIEADVSEEGQQIVVLDDAV